MSDIERKIERIIFHQKLLADQSCMATLTSIAVHQDWSQKQYNSIHDVFEKYDKILKAAGVPSRADFKRDIQKVDPNVSVLVLINGVHFEEKWDTVCKWLMDDIGELKDTI